VHVEGLVGQAPGPLGEIGHQRGLAVSSIEAPEVLRGRLLALAGELDETVVVDTFSCVGRKFQGADEP
jgi:hypothetical protein